MFPQVSLPQIVLLLTFQVLHLGLGVTVLVAALVLWKETKPVLGRGFLLSGLIALLQLPSVIVTMLFLDVKGMAAGAPPEFTRLVAVIAAAATVAGFVIAFLYGALQVAVARIAGGPAALPLLLRGGAPWAGWGVAAAFGVLAGAISLALFHLVGAQPGVIFRQLATLFPRLQMVPRPALMALSLATVLAAALSEELLYRGVVQAGLIRLLGGRLWAVVLSIVLTSAAWAVPHLLNVDQALLKLAQVFVLGLALGALSRRFSVEAAMIAHATLNLVAGVGGFLLLPS
jgi:membrane protease YdiL (CAAX protease family)